MLAATLVVALVQTAAAPPDLATVRQWFEAGKHQQVVAVTLNDASTPSLIYLAGRTEPRPACTTRARARRLRTAGRSLRDRPVALRRSRRDPAGRHTSGPGARRRPASGHARPHGRRGALPARASAGRTTGLRQGGASVRDSHRHRSDASLRALLRGALVLPGGTHRSDGELLRIVPEAGPRSARAPAGRVDHAHRPRPPLTGTGLPPNHSLSST